MDANDVDDDPEFEAIKSVVSALLPLDDAARRRVLDYTFERLQLSAASVPATSASLKREEASAPEAPTSEPAPTVSRHAADYHPVDIRTFKEAKSPKSANEMAAVLAYYLEYEAPDDEKKSYVTADDVNKYFHLAKFTKPANASMTLAHSKNAGYLDLMDRGQYKLNPVGYNLVAHKLPGEGTASPKKSPRVKKAASKPATAKKPKASETRKESKAATGRQSSRTTKKK